jgi:protocatechuate 3,4-dioxygenase beta subunit
MNTNLKKILTCFCIMLAIMIPSMVPACNSQSLSPSRSLQPSATAAAASTVSPGVLTTNPASNVPNTCPGTFIVEETEGPFYKAGSPERTNLIETGIPGDPITLTGYIFDKNCNPITGAWLDFWQADGNGQYDNNGYKLRGHQFTDSQGKYILQTVMPGEYPGRTNHIHVKISKSEAVSKSETQGSIITTQLYFSGATRNSSDPLFNQSMLVTMSEINGQKVAFFNFKLN